VNTVRPAPGQKWVLTKMQMVNWGCYQSHVPVALPPGQTLIVGASGAGKSTLLDVHTALLYRNRARFNTASNPSEKGRPRGPEERNIARYMRGRVAGSKDAEGRPIDRDLREGTTWSALAETYQRDDGTTFTLWVAYYMRPTDPRPSIKRFAYVMDDFDLRALQDFVGPEHTSRPLPMSAIKATHPGTVFCDGETDFRDRVYEILGLNRDAARLLEDIQSAAKIDSVTGLFRDLVLEEPATYAAADSALEHFSACASIYQSLQDHEDKVRLLDSIPEWHTAMEKRRESALFLSKLGATAQPADTPFWQWVRDVENTLLNEEVDNNRMLRQETKEALVAAHQRRDKAKARLSDCQRRVHSVGGADAAVLEQQISTAESALTRARIQRDTLAAAVGTLIPLADSEAAHVGQQADSRKWLEGATKRKAASQGRRDDLTGKIAALSLTIGSLKSKGAHFLNRRDLLPEHAVRDRRDFAETLGLPIERLAFVAELIDMDPDWEPWRMAVEKALGGYAYQLLIPETVADAYRAMADEKRTIRRYNFTAVADHDMDLIALDPATAAGRIRFRAGHPYAPWLASTLRDRLDHVCVPDAAALNRLPRGARGLTITGQVRERDGKRGSHGGQVRHEPIIGFSPKALLDQIAEEIQSHAEEWEALNEQRRDVESEQARDEEATAAHEAVVRTPWDELDVASREADLADLDRRRTALREGNQELKEAEEEAAEAEGVYEGSVTAASEAEIASKAAEAAHVSLTERQDKVTRHQDRMLEANVAFTDHARLTSRFTEWHGGEPTLEVLTEHNLGKFSNVLVADAIKQNTGAQRMYDLLHAAFSEYNRRWPDDNRTDDPDTAYVEFESILTNLRAMGLDGARDDFRRHIDTMTGLELVKVKQQFDAAPAEIRARLKEVDNLLSTLDYSSRGGKISLVAHEDRGKEAQDFIAKIVALSEDATMEFDFDRAVARFNDLRELMDLIDPDKTMDKGSRDRILDVRRHMNVEAHHTLPDGTLFSTHDSLGDRSGGEAAELTMFILGAALRYQLGDLDAAQPRFAPVFMDEGMVKADPEHTDRALRVWVTLGFQPLIALPVDKFESAQQSTPTYTLQISRDHRGVSRIDPLIPVS
jgi:uncharacterized protein YPO0396